MNSFSIARHAFMQFQEQSANTRKWPILEQTSKLCCDLPSCALCTQGSMSKLNDVALNQHGWKKRLMFVFEMLKKTFPDQEWFSLSKEVYPFFQNHWEVLFPGVNSVFQTNWKKKVQDSLSHNRDVFESGTSVFGKKGFWRSIDTCEEENVLEEPLPLAHIRSLISEFLARNTHVEIQRPSAQIPEETGCKADEALSKEFEMYLQRRGITSACQSIIK